MARSRGRFPAPGSDDPLALVQDDLEGRSRPSGRPDRPRRSNPEPERRRSVPVLDFPECPADRSERTWRLTRQFIEAGEATGMRRVVSPWVFARELAATIKASRPVLDFIAANGQDLAEDIFGRMIRLFWRDYVTHGIGRSMAVNLFLDDYWDDLFDQAKTQYTTDRIQEQIARGTLKVHPKRNYHSLLNDADYQATLADLRVHDKLESQLSQPLHRDPANSNPEASSEALSGRVIDRGRSGRDNAGGDPGQP